VIRWVLGLLAMLGWCVAEAQGRPLSVVFLNPGHAAEPFWAHKSHKMQDAPRHLGNDLRVIYGERDTARILRNAHRVLEGEHPDYLIFVNEQFTGPEILRLFDGTQVRLFALHSTLTPEQQALVGGSRERYRHWLGSLVPNDEEAGYLMGQALIALAGGQPAQMLAFTGIKQTPSATLRVAGLQRALAEAPHIRLQQVLYGEWRQQRAYEQALALLPRYPQLSLVWSANDEMAFGVMQAATEQGRQLRYAALNNSARVLQARVDGRLEVLASGHFLLGACALVMLHDHARGLDFAARGGKDQVASLLRLVDGADAGRLIRRLVQDDIDLDFRQFSAIRQPRMSRYACSIDSLLR
jgi:DNA-binding LacI/PurR family transcriptional regulator